MFSPSSAEPGGGPGRRRRVALLGSTGSIGRQAIEVLEANASAFEVVALAAGSNETMLAEQAARLRPAAVSLADDGRLAALTLPPGVERVAGSGALEALATRPDVDLVLVALRAGKIVATANKETLVAGGHLVMPLARRLARQAAARDPRDPAASPLAWLRPIDSEHSAIWQCLVGERATSIAALILTASGGPFLDADEDILSGATPELALRHPTWSMGAKITIDSATLVNKGLEVIEAHWLYDVGFDAIEVVIHPQSVIHSAVRFVDGSLKAQLGNPDMRVPIQYALTYPDRRPSPTATPDLIGFARLDFRAPDVARFPALRICRDAGTAGPWASAALIAADDVAVSRFLGGTLDFPDIPRLLEAAIERFGTNPGEPGLDDLEGLDAAVRAAYASGPIGASS
jgi:1-deoxy-D-xylulose-5-phosphate reductoisomerase